VTIKIKHVEKTCVKLAGKSFILKRIIELSTNPAKVI